MTDTSNLSSVSRGIQVVAIKGPKIMIIRSTLTFFFFVFHVNHCPLTFCCSAKGTQREITEKDVPDLGLQSTLS